MKFDSGASMKLYRQTVEDFRLYPGAELSAEQMAALEEAAGAMSAKMRAVRIVTASNVSRKDLERRLVQKGENPDQAKDAVEWMEELNLLDDRRTARQIVESCAHKGYGLMRAKQALYEKQIPKHLWEEALEDYPDQTEYIVKFLKMKISDPEDQKQVKRAIDALMRRGHGYGQIRRALDRIGADSGDFMEDE